MRMPWTNRFYRSQHRDKIIWVALCLLLVLALIGGLLSTFILKYTSSSSSLNAGKSVLWLSNPELDPYALVKYLTMIRTSDGSVLWQYHLQGTLAGGYAHQLTDQLHSGTAVRIVNGIVYFAEALHAGPDIPAMTTFSLTALRADTGTIMWRHQMIATTLEIMGISHGLLVSLMTTGSNSQVDTLSAAGYRADTGSLVWHRQIAEHISYGNPPAQLFGEALYVELAPAWTLLALDARTGKPRWKYFWQAREQKVFTWAVYPLTASHGIIVVAGMTGSSFDQSKVNLRGLRQSNGVLVWQKELSRQGGFLGDLYSPLQTDENLIYFATNVPTQDDLELNALQVSSGMLLWHQQIATSTTRNLRALGLANGVLYLPYQLKTQGNAQETSPFIVQAVQARSGSVLWQYLPGKPVALFAMVSEMKASTIITSTDSNSNYDSMVALNIKNGTARWQNSLNGFGGSVADGKIISFVYRDRPPYSDFKQRLCALQANTGASLWCHDADGINNWVIAAS